MVLQPVHQRQVISETTEQVHRGMGMTVDQSRDQRMLIETAHGMCLILLFCLIARQDVDDLLLVDSDGMVWQTTSLAIDRNHPAGVYQCIDILHGARH